jgi:glycosyltransferase involved in cell wall biosynthesis
MKILFHSNAPWMATGYGTQCAIWTTRLRDLGHDIAIHGYAGAQHLTVEWNGIPVFAAGTQNAIGMDAIGYWYEKHRADVVISLCDAWALAPSMMRLMNTVCWTPVDAEPLSAGLRDFFTETNARPLAMSEYGQRIFREGGVDAAMIPHGIPMDLFKPPEFRDALRAEAGIGPDTFVVGINQANRSGLRKALPEQIAAFARFWRRHPDSKLLLNMAVDHPKGQDLPLLLSRHGIPPGEGVACFPDQGAYAAGEISTESMPLWYGSLDVLTGCAMAGGFELPLLEAQACGTPVIATDFSAMTEVAGPHSWLVKGQPFWVEERHQGFWCMPFIHEIDAALEDAWQAREDGRMEGLRKQSREHALQYDADKILRERWVPFLAEVEAAL